MRTIVIPLAVVAATVAGPVAFASAAGTVSGDPYVYEHATSTTPDRTIRATPYGAMTADGTSAQRLAAAEEMPYFVGGPAANGAERFDPTPTEPTRPTEESVVDGDDSSALSWILGIGALALVFSALMATRRTRTPEPPPIDDSSFAEADHLHHTPAR